MEYFDNQLAYCKQSLSTGEGYQTAEYDLAAVYAFLGEEERALDYLRRYAEKGFTYGFHVYIIRDPLFYGLWNKEEFKKIVQEVQEQKLGLRKLIMELEEKSI